MPSTILSDNGVTSGTAGIKTTGSNDGQLALQTTTAGGATATGLTINNTQQVAFTAGSAASPAITPTGDDNTGIFFPAADTIAFAEGGAEAMRINSSGNVGIGTSSQTQRLEVYNSATNSQCYAVVQNNRARNAAVLTKTTNGGFYTGTSIGTDTLCWQVYDETNGERMRIDSSGNVGIGVTPSSWGSSFKVLQLASSAVINNGTNDTFIGANYYFDGANNRYINTDFASAYGLQEGDHRWYTAPSGTGGNTATFTERARISAAGGFSVGTTADPGAGAIYATGNITAYYSDSRLKDVKGNITGALDKVASLNGVYYTNNDVAAKHGYTAQDLQVGLLAQQVEAVLPEVVKAAPFDLDENGNSKSGENYKTVQYERIIPLLVEAIKELRAEVKALKGE